MWYIYKYKMCGKGGFVLLMLLGTVANIRGFNF